MTNWLTLGTDETRFGAEVAIGIYLQLNAAVAEDSFRHYGDHINTLHLGGNDEWRWFVVGIGSTCANGSHECFRLGNDVAVPFLALKKRYDGVAARQGTIEHNVGIQSNQLSILIAVAIAGTGTPRLDVAQYRTRIAANGIRVRHWSLHHDASRELLRARDQGSQECGGCERRRRL